MLTLSSSNYKREDYIAFAVALESKLKCFIHCPDKLSHKCTTCEYKHCCYDLNYLYSYLLEKIK